MHGWVPITIQIIAGIALVAAIGWRNRRWRYMWLPWAALCGVAVTVTAYWYIASEGLAGDPAPDGLWIWIGLSGAAAAVLIAGWRGATWWRRGVAVTALPLCLLCAALALNLWVGYFPTVADGMESADRRPAARPDGPGDRDRRCSSATRSPRRAPWCPCRSATRIGLQAPRRTRLPATRLVRDRPTAASADDDDDRRRVQHPRRLGADRQCGRASSTNSPPPTVATRRYWSSSMPAARSTTTPNASTAAAATPPTISPKTLSHIMVSHFGVSAHRENWGVVGLVDGRHMCRRPRGDAPRHVQRVRGHRRRQSPPTPGTKDQTIARLFGGNAAAYAAFDPTAVIKRHGIYTGVTGWFDINGQAAVGTDGRRRIHCARWEAPTGSPVRSWSSPASTTGRSLRMRSTPRCRGWPANSALPPCRRSRCRHRRRSVPIVQAAAK